MEAATQKDKLFSWEISFCEETLLTVRTNWMTRWQESSRELFITFVDPFYQRERKVQGQHFKFPWMNMNKY